MAGKANRWDDLVDRLARDGREQADRLADKVRGGPTAPGRVHLTRHEQLRQYMLFTVPYAQLSPDQAEERRLIWTKRLSKLSELELKEHALEMERLRLVATRGAGLPPLEGEMGGEGPLEIPDGGGFEPDQVPLV